MSAMTNGIAWFQIGVPDAAAAKRFYADLFGWTFTKDDDPNLPQFKQLYQDFRKTNKKEAVVLEVLRGVNTEVIRIEPPQ